MVVSIQVETGVSDSTTTRHRDTRFVGNSSPRLRPTLSPSVAPELRQACLVAPQLNMETPMLSTTVRLAFAWFLIGHAQ